MSTDRTSVAAWSHLSNLYGEVWDTPDEGMLWGEPSLAGLTWFTHLRQDLNDRVGYVLDGLNLEVQVESWHVAGDDVVVHGTISVGSRGCYETESVIHRFPARLLTMDWERRQPAVADFHEVLAHQQRQKEAAAVSERAHVRAIAEQRDKEQRRADYDRLRREFGS